MPNLTVVIGDRGSRGAQAQDTYNTVRMHSDTCMIVATVSEQLMPRHAMYGSAGRSVTGNIPDPPVNARDMGAPLNLVLMA